MKKIIIAVVALAVGSFLWWTLSPLFIEKEVQDELDPAIKAALESQLASEPEALPDIPESEDNSSTESEVLIVAESQDDSPTTLPQTPEATVTTPTNETSTPAPGVTPGPIVRGPFTIEDTAGHPATGQARVIETAEETLVRFEDYDGTNGPDLRVYLATDLEATSFVDLGKAKGNKGNINYTIPADVDVDDYTYVMTWCRAFGVLFDYAEIK